MRWYVVQILSGREEEVAERLKESGITALLPKEGGLIRSRGAWGYKEYLLCPGYVFSSLDYSAESYYRVKEIPGVTRFLGAPGSPSYLSYLEAEWVKALSGEDNAPIEPTEIEELPDGGIRIISGVLKKFESRIVTLDKRSRKATVELTLCGERKEVTLSIRLKGDKLCEAGSDAAENAAEEVLQEVKEHLKAEEHLKAPLLKEAT